MPVEASLIEILACPACRAPLEDRTEADPARLTCTSADCGLAYPVRDGIPVLLVDEALPHDPEGAGDTTPA
ncbi:Trm112 family protein [Streptomyces sp. NPDC048650]|uniref:Trm112 family protein n=1 Tax=unclassified Streptomyces TaxID=2593676 RepID=UPI003724B983